jgi:hypothetical protein
MPYSTLRIYVENVVGRLLENPKGYVVVEYKPGLCRLGYQQALLHHATQLLVHNNWHKLLGDQRLRSSFTPEESQWDREYWFSAA